MSRGRRESSEVANPQRWALPGSCHRFTEQWSAQQNGLWPMAGHTTGVQSMSAAWTKKVRELEWETGSCPLMSAFTLPFPSYHFCCWGDAASLLPSWHWGRTAWERSWPSEAQQAPRCPHSPRCCPLQWSSLRCQRPQRSPPSPWTAGTVPAEEGGGWPQRWSMWSDLGTCGWGTDREER